MDREFLERENHTTPLQCDHIQNNPHPAGTPQGSPLSPILYMYYNGDLLDITRRCPCCHSLGFIDDIAYSIQGQSDNRNAAVIHAMLEEAET
jgi:hypothetical protein